MLCMFFIYDMQPPSYTPSPTPKEKQRQNKETIT